MASKYDVYWGGQLHRIREGLRLAATGVPAVVRVPELARLGGRQSWYGIAEVRGQELTNSSGAHATSLGKQIMASGICNQWPQCTFRLVIGADGGVLTITMTQKGNGPEIHPPRVFMSYRRDDTDYPAAWLFAELAKHFDKDQVFKDVDSIELGDDFVEVITSAVASCDVLLALIGRRWLTVTGEDGRRRLDNPDDFVRLEIEAALTRNVRVIPILVEAAHMPRADELPPSLAKLTRRQALELSSGRFGLDARRLLRTLDRTLAESPGQSRLLAGRVNRPQQQVGPLGEADPSSPDVPRPGLLAHREARGRFMSSRPTAIEALARAPATSGLILDFDGVLSPIVADPTASAMPDPVRAVLVRLAKRLGLLAVMSGRPVDFLAERVRVPGVRLLGSYGIEQIRDGERQIDPDAKKWLGPVREAAHALDVLLGAFPGIRVEEISVSVAVHWRQARNQAAAADEVRRATARIAAETGLRLERGKLVEELRPPIDVDKGSAIIALLAGERLTAVAYAGDDLGDIPALRAVREVDGGYALVVDHGSETDPHLLTLADQSYAGTEGFAAWLAELADAIGA